MYIKLVADCNIHLKLIGFGHASGEVHLSTDWILSYFKSHYICMAWTRLSFYSDACMLNTWEKTIQIRIYVSLKNNCYNVQF